MAEGETAGGLPWAELRVPPSWDVHAEYHLVEPPQRGPGVPFAARADTPMPRAHVLLTLAPANAQEEVAALEETIADLAGVATHFKQLDGGTLTFHDGGRGVYATVSFAVDEHMRAAQMHVFRRDGERMAHFTLSVEEFSKDKLNHELLELVRTFRPTSPR